MRRKELEGYLGSIEGFVKPKILLEQYVTGVDIAASLLLRMEEDEAIDGKIVGDLGCGTGVLTIGMAIMGAKHCIGIELDDEAVASCSENVEEFDLNDRIDLLQADVTAQLPFLHHNSHSHSQHKQQPIVQTILMNPPFGTKKNAGIDMKFLEAASKLASERIYSLHKSSTRQHVLKRAEGLGLEAEVIAELRYDLPATYKCHKQKSADIHVDFIRFNIPLSR